VTTAYPLGVRRWARTTTRLLGMAVVTAAAAAAVTLTGGTSAHATPTAAQLDTQIQQQSAAFEKVVEQYDKATDQQKKTAGQIAGLDKQLAPLVARVDTMQRQVGKLAADAYKSGALGTVNALLSAGSPDGLLSTVSTLDQVSTGQQRQVHGLVTAKAKLDGQRATLATLNATQAKAAAALAAKKKTITAQLDQLKQLREQAYGSNATEAQTTYTGSVPQVSGSAGAVVSFAYAQIGKPYVWAASGPDSYDCSGLTMAAWQQAGVSLSHNAADQYNSISHVDRSSIQPGDLVFYEDLGHVAIYVGGGQVIHAPEPGENVKLSSIDMMPVYGIGRP
jgi:cell wall-associated NlpC family hydrolase